MISLPRVCPLHFFGLLSPLLLFLLLTPPAAHAAGKQSPMAVPFKRTPRPAAEYRNPLQIHQAIQSATEVRIYGQHINATHQPDWDTEPLLTLSEHSHSDMFRLLKGAKRYGDFGIKSGFQYIFIFVIPGKPLQAYNYNGVLSQWSTTGEAAMLPTGFVTWLRKHPFMRL